MPQSIQTVSPAERVALRITTGCAHGGSVYVMDAPDQEGYRRISRNNDPEFTGKIAGPVKDISVIALDGVTLITQIEDGRYVLESFSIAVGDSMGIRKKGDTETTFVSRPIISIETC